MIVLQKFLSYSFTVNSPFVIFELMYTFVFSDYTKAQLIAAVWEQKGVYRCKQRQHLVPSKYIVITH